MDDPQNRFKKAGVPGARVAARKKVCANPEFLRIKYPSKHDPKGNRTTEIGCMDTSHASTIDSTVKDRLLMWFVDRFCTAARRS
jgi:hypothetical protein